MAFIKYIYTEINLKASLFIWRMAGLLFFGFLALPVFFLSCTPPPQYHRNLKERVEKKEEKRSVTDTKTEKQQKHEKKDSISKSGDFSHVRVLVYDGPNPPSIEFNDKYVILNREDEIVSKREAGVLVVTPRNYPPFSQVFSNKEAIFGGNRYPGHFYIIQEENRWLLINELPFEDYIKGVVPAEMPANWHVEALKAQAIAARTYALYQISKTQDKLYHLKASVASQVYRGLERRTPQSDQAVTETSGMVMYYQDSLFPAFFHSTSGGITEHGADVWTGGDSFGFTQVKVTDYGRISPHQNWEYEFDTLEFLRLLKMKYEFDVVRGFRVVNRTKSGRVREVEIKGLQNGQFVQKNIQGNKFRIAIGSTRIKSLLFHLGRGNAGGASTVKFVGHGYGHGVGLCQWGAYDMASQGKQAPDILHYYYKDIIIRRFNQSLLVASGI